jgi:hypothetical protein
MGNERLTESTPPPKRKSLALQVPPNIDLEKMSAEEIERLAIDMVQKVSASVPKNSTVLGIDRLVLTNAPTSDIGIGVIVHWTRACEPWWPIFGDREPQVGVAERKGIGVNPEAFVDPAIDAIDIATHPSHKTVTDRKKS